MNEIVRMDRRFFVLAGLSASGGLAVGLAPHSAVAGMTDAAVWTKDAPTGSGEFTPWVSIAPDDTVSVRVTAPDIGNGTLTQACAFVKEELGADWSKMRAEYAAVQRDVQEGNVYSKVGGLLGYFSGRSTGPARMDTYLRVGASARERLKLAAAQQWDVPVAEVTVENGVLAHKASGRTLRFGEVAQKAATVTLDKEPEPKPQSAWTFLGKESPSKLQNPNIVNGSAVYGIDVRVPNMVYAALRQAPVQGGKVKSYDFEAIRKMPGVHAVVVVDPGEPRKSDLKPPFPFGITTAQSAVAVIADHYWQARTALDALPIEWDNGPGSRWKTTQQVYDAAIKALEKEGEKIEKSSGDIAAAMNGPGKLVEATYHTPYCDHSSLEPLNGTAMVDGDRVEVWHPSQHSQQGAFVVADECGTTPDKVTFHQTFVGGSFGRRVYSDDVRMVAAVARKFPGRPVHVIWSREETMRQGRYRAMEAARFRAKLDESGLPVGFHARISGRGMSVSGLADTALANGVVPNVQIESQTLPLHILTGPYRGPGYNSNSFFVETFVDECAHAAGIDPLEYRLRLYGKWGDIGWTKCLKEVAEKAGWGKTLPKGQAQGIAVANWGMNSKVEAGTTVATVATVEVSKQGELKILALDVAFDTGRIVNRDAIETEVVGGTLFGLNMCLNEELNIKDGRIVEGNFDEYPLLRMADAPKVNVHFGGLSDKPRFNEIGEPPVGPVGPAISNAVFKITGKRIRSMPFRTQDLSWA